MRKIAAIFIAFVVALGFFSANPTPTEATCSEAKLILYGNDDGTGGKYTLCWPASIYSFNFSNGAQTCQGFLGFDNGTWNNCFTSVWLTGLPGRCIYLYDGQNWSGDYIIMCTSFQGNLGPGFGHSWQDWCCPPFDDKISSARWEGAGT